MVVAAAAAADRRQSSKVERTVAVAVVGVLVLQWVDSNYRLWDVIGWALSTIVGGYHGEVYAMGHDHRDTRGALKWRWTCPVACQRRRIGYVLRIWSVHHVREERWKSPNHGLQKKL